MSVQDRRRLLGPSNAKPLSFASSDGKITANQGEDKSLEEIDISFYTGIIGNCNGSSIVEMKDGVNTHHQISLITSVYGPRAIRGSFTSQAAITIQIKNGSLEKYETSQLKEVAGFLTSTFNSVVNLTKYPKSGIDIFIYLTNNKDLGNGDDENRISAIIPQCIMGITLALSDAEIEMTDICAAGYKNGNVYSFIKNGESINGFWKDKGEKSDIIESLADCKKQYLTYKAMIIKYLIEKDEIK